MDEYLKSITGVIIFYDAAANGGSGGWRWTIQNAQIPIVKLIGYLVKLQGWLIYRKADKCDAPALVIEWDAAERELSYSVNDKLPVDELIGTLELFKAQLVDGQIAQIMALQQKAQESPLLAADGRPARKV